MRRTTLCALLLVLGLLSCGSNPVTVEADPEAEYRGVDLYTYAPASLLLEQDARDPNLRQARVEFREALSAELEALGLRESRTGEAPLVIEYRVLVEERLRDLDPEYTFHSVEKLEDGLISLEFIDSESRVTVWSGRTRLFLRRVAAGAGITSINWEPLDEERSWRIPEMLDALIARSGIADRDEAAARGDRPLSREARRDFFKRLYETLPEKKVELESEN